MMEVMQQQRNVSWRAVMCFTSRSGSRPHRRRLRDRGGAPVDEDVLGYTTAGGHPALRARVAQHYREWYDVDVDPGAVMFSVGASGAFVAAFLAAFDVGDRVVVPSPGYPCYRNALDALGCEVVDLPTTMATRFQPTTELLDGLVADGGPIAGLVLSSPSNPSGTMLDRVRMAEITDWCREHGVWFVSDEITGSPTASRLRPRCSSILTQS